MSKTTLLLIVLCVALAIHYVSQKTLLKKGWEAENPKPYINRFMINGAGLIVIAIAALIAAKPPYGLFGILIFIEGAVCVTFGRKLSKKPKS
ncbi:hypothetical protein [Pontiella agarivorans]|uniref:DUF3325 domain-containing protein n=1 Tax=Pontiella agarivorans TaxID=3038953 RepID=A0ABU5MYC3_9BACT|nr:hypothetical protein [Pontiella agarivorans]MDZ8119194.1 hypothetical protein [Pontiella agarivorans]